MRHRLCPFTFYFTLSLLSSALAECTPNWVWQWKVVPTLSISGPTTLPDSCIGVQLNIGPGVITKTQGIKWQVDVNACDPNNLTRNETPVDISPVNTWDLYSGQGNPPTGSGVTATFTPTLAGTFVVQFRTSATNTTPAWNSGLLGYRTSPFRVTEVSFLMPDQGSQVQFAFPPKFTVCPGPGYVTVTATPYPLMTESELPTCWSFIGGLPVGSGKLVRRVPKTPGQTTFTCTSGTSTKTVIIKIDNCLCSTPLSDAEWTGDVKPICPYMNRCHTCREAPATTNYNCLAWTVGVTTTPLWFEADSNNDMVLSPQEVTSFHNLYAIPAGTITYYGTSMNIVQHVAKKSGGPGGDCYGSSKLGQLLRMSHDINEMAGGPFYGSIIGGN